jgi:hypothetical protein
MAPTSAVSSFDWIARFSERPASSVAEVLAMNSSAAPSGYGCGMLSVFSAISRAEQRR